MSSARRAHARRSYRRRLSNHGLPAFLRGSAPRERDLLAEGRAVLRALQADLDEVSALSARLKASLEAPPEFLRLGALVLRREGLGPGR